MGIFSELMLPKGFDAVWGLCTDTITSKIKSSAEQQKINEKLEAYLSRKLKDNWFCTREEEIDFEGLANYIRGDLLADVEIRLFGKKQQERELARKRILEKAAIYASANTTLSRQRAQKMVSDVVEILNNLWHTKVPKELRMMSGEIVDEICLHQTEQTERVLSNLDHAQDSIMQKIEGTSCLSAESNLLLMKNGQSEEAVKRMTAGLQALSATHPNPDFRIGFRTVGLNPEMYSIPISKEVAERYPPKLELTVTATLGGKPVSNLNSQNLNYSYRHQLPFVLNIISAKKYLGAYEDPFQFEAEREKGKKYALHPPAFPPAFPCSLIGDDKPILEYMLLRTKEILDDGTIIVTNEEQKNAAFRIAFRLHVPNNLFSFEFKPLTHTNKERLSMAQAFQAMSESSVIKLRLLDVGEDLACGKLPPDFLEGHQTLSEDVAIFKNIVDVEQYFENTILLPDVAMPEDLRNLAYIAKLVRGDTCRSSWEEWEFEVPINQQIKAMAENSDEMIDKEFRLFLSGEASIELWGHTYKLPLVRTLCSATIKDWERVRKKIEALDIGDPLKLTMIPGKSGNLVEDELDKRYKQN